MSYFFSKQEQSTSNSYDTQPSFRTRRPATPTPERFANAQHRWVSGGVNGRAAMAVEMPELLRAAQLGDELAFGSLMDHYHHIAARVARQILRTEEAAADAVQEAMIKVYRALPRFQEGNFRSWLLRIVTNTCYDHLRRQKRRNALSLDELTEGSDGEATIGARIADDVEDPETVALQHEGMQLLLAAINALPHWHRNVVLLIDVHGYDYEEAAAHLGVPLGTIKSRLSRGRAALRDRLVQEGLVPNHLVKQQ
ncbi:MAG: sigma-70 family RNA polymerase sigma factor [Caldilineaceae bacterium]